ncbi:hypothetical protein ES703_105712 [subsurface metagenome]
MENLRLFYWTLVVATAIIFLLCLSMTIDGDRLHRLVGLVIIGIEALLWACLTGRRWRK